MNAAIELHDSKLASVTHVGAVVVAAFAPAYLHPSEGKPGIDAGSGWLQSATFAFAGGTVSRWADLPCEVSDGSLQIGGVSHDNLVPAVGKFETPCELRVVLQNSAALVIRGDGLTIRLHGEPRHLESYGSER